MMGTRIQFKESHNKNIDIVNDNYIIKAKKILSIKNPKIHGSYLKYGKDKACDLDMKETISHDYKTKELKTLCDKLISYRSDFILVELDFFIEDTRITDIIKKIGYMDGILKIHDMNIDNIYNIIDVTLPINIRDDIIMLCNDLNDLNKNNYIKLYNYLYKLNHPNWTLEEFKNGEKYINGRLIKLYESNFNSFYIQVIIDNFMSSNYIEFIDDMMIEDNKSNVLCKMYDIYDIIDTNIICISYYLLLKKLQVFLKWGFFNRIYKEHHLVKLAIITYNDIYTFRENIGTTYNKLCSLHTKIILCKDKNKKDVLEIQYKKEFNEFNNISKKYYYKQSNKYKLYLQKYVKMDALL